MRFSEGRRQIARRGDGPDWTDGLADRCGRTVEGRGPLWTDACPFVLAGP